MVAKVLTPEKKAALKEILKNSKNAKKVTFVIEPSLIPAYNDDLNVPVLGCQDMIEEYAKRTFPNAKLYVSVLPVEQFKLLWLGIKAIFRKKLSGEFLNTYDTLKFRATLFGLDEEQLLIIKMKFSR